MSTRRLLPATATLALGLLLPVAPAGAQTAITVGKITSGIGLHVPSYVAMDKGFFKEEGLNARWVVLGGRAMMSAGLSGNLQFVPVPSGGAQAVLKAGAKIRYIVNQSLKPLYVFVARPEITKPEDLRGKTIGLARAGAADYDEAITVLARFFNMQPGRDYKVLSMTGDPERVGALLNKSIDAAMATLRSAEQPLVVIGKGAAYSRAEDEVRQFIETTQLPFLTSPMGKGMLEDDHPLSVAAARTQALQNADVIFLIGARLNWIMHFGLNPRFRDDVRIVQMDIEPEEMSANVTTEVGLVGDARAITAQLNAHLAQHPWQYPLETTWRTGLQRKIEDNAASNAEFMQDDSVPLGYYRVLREVRDALPRDVMICSEGAATMDLGRQVLNNYLPRHRLDAGTWGTMGVGLAFAIASQLVHPDKPVIAVEGDSAFGFSGMEFEVACRYGLPITVVIVNNNGVGGGPSELDRSNIPPGSYYPNAHYEKLAEAFGGQGFYVETPDELGPALQQALNSGVPSIVNVMIGTKSPRRAREFAWHTR